jgi:hypothetical protein
MNRIVLIISIIALTSLCTKADSQSPTTVSLTTKINLAEIQARVKQLRLQEVITMRRW